MVVVVLVTTIVMGTRPADPSVAGNARREHSWGTQMAMLQADALTIEVGGRAFNPPPDTAVHSDPGSVTYRTMEMAWRDGGTEMRLNIYFGANGSKWWISSVRTYDGTSPGDWIYYVTPQISAGLGQPWAGDVDVLGLGFHGIGRLRIRGATLSAFAPGTIPHSFAGCRPAGPVQGNPLQPMMGRMNPDIAGVALTAGMDASAAETSLRANGTCYEFRREYPAENQGQVWCAAPLGNVREWAFSSTGAVILFVEAPPRETLPPNWPQVVGC